MNSPPSDSVARAFGLFGEPELLPGGQGRTYAVGNSVVRPEDECDVGAWTAEVMASLPQKGFRVPRPVPRLDGNGWVVDGWTAWERVPGEHRTWGADWKTALSVAIRFHDALAAAPRPHTLHQRFGVFAVADRMAWAESPLPPRGRLADVLQQLARQRVAIPEPRQVVHGDMAGNLLWHAELPPAVIDMSPYWRPRGLGAAQLVTDAVLWYGADVTLADSFLAFEPAHGRQLVLRALIFRLSIDAQLDTGAAPGVRWDASQVDWDLQHAAPLAAWATGEAIH